MSQKIERSIAKLPRIVRTSFGLVWAADPLRFVVSSGLQVVTAVVSGLQLLAINGALTSVLAAAGRGMSLTSIARDVAWAVIATLALRASGIVRTLFEESLLALKVTREADARVLDVATSVDLESFEDPSFFDRLQRASANASSRPATMVRGLLGVGGSLLSLVAVCSALARLHPWLVPLVAVGALPLWWIGVRNTRDAYWSNVRFTEANRHRQYLRRILTGRDEAKEVRAFGLAPLLRRYYDARYDEWITEQRRLTRRRMLRQLLGYQLPGGLVTLVTGGTLLWMVTSGRMHVAAATTAVYALQRLRTQVNGLLFGLNNLYSSAVFLDDLQWFLDLKPALEASRPTRRAHGPFTSLAVRDVSFAYPGSPEPALRGVDLEVHAGEVVALVGENGSGKTTLAKLLCHLYRPSSGRIVWDGVDTSGWDPRSVREHVAVIFQDFVRYELPARDNVGVGRPERADDLAAVERAARASGAHADIAALPSGYETYLTRTIEGGRDLSVGQWQRVALARAFFRDASFLVLDEPTAALDPRAEHALFESVRALSRGRAALLISHRFSTVRTADRIYVLHAGEVVEHGTHEELMAAGGLYAELFTLQASAYGLVSTSGPAAAASPA